MYIFFIKKEKSRYTDSSFGNLLENIGNQITKFSYKTDRIINSYILTEQTQHISNLLDKYEDHTCKPEKSHYEISLLSNLEILLVLKLNTSMIIGFMTKIPKHII